jgi:hypothetical protein
MFILNIAGVSLLMYQPIFPELVVPFIVSPYYPGGAIRKWA